MYDDDDDFDRTVRDIRVNRIRKPLYYGGLAVLLAGIVFLVGGGIAGIWNATELWVSVRVLLIGLIIGIVGAIATGIANEDDLWRVNSNHWTQR